MFCRGQEKAFPLSGSISGEFDLNSLSWNIVSQPPGSDLQILNHKSLITETTVPKV